MAETRYVDPIHHPTYASQPMRDIRAWLLLAVTVVLPGGVQLLFGARRWAKVSLSITGLSWLLAIVTGLMLLINWKSAFGLAANPIVLTFLTVWIPVLGLNWLVCLLDSLRRIRLVTLSTRARQRFLAVFCVLLLVVTGPMVWGTTIINSGRGLVSDLFAFGSGAKPVDGRYNILLLGSDAGKGRTGIRPDSMSLVSINAKTGATVIVGLPRNMENVPFPEDSPLHAVYPQGYNCGDECLLNAVFQQGERHRDEFENPKQAGERATMDAASAITGLQVQNYVMVNLKGFQNLIDSLGGITLKSEKRVPVSSKVDPKTGEHGPVKEWIEPGTLKLDGYHALWYARSREFSSDYERMIRQRCVQTAMVKQMDPTTVLTHFQAIAKATPGALSTDIPSGQLDTFLDLALKVKSQKIDSLDLTPPRVTPSHPDFAEARRLVKEQIAASDKNAGQKQEALGTDPVGGASGSAALAGGAVHTESLRAEALHTATPRTEKIVAAGAAGSDSDTSAAEAICSVP